MKHVIELLVTALSVSVFAFLYVAADAAVEGWRVVRARRAEDRRIRVEDEERAVADRRGYR